MHQLSQTGLSICLNHTTIHERWRLEERRCRLMKQPAQLGFHRILTGSSDARMRACQQALPPSVTSSGPTCQCGDMSSRRSEVFTRSTLTTCDLCMRVAATHPNEEILFEPRAIVHHFVPAKRVEWHYFWRRCFFVNREKVHAYSEMGEAANIRAEREFVLRALTKQFAADASDVLRGRISGLSRMGAMVVGLTMAAAGHAAGLFQAGTRRPH